MFQSKLLATRDGTKKKQQHNHQNHSFTYLPSNDNDVVLQDRIKKSSKPKQQQHQQTAVYPPTASSYYFTSRNTQIVKQQQRPLSDLNHSFTSFNLYRTSSTSNSNDNKVLIQPVRPFVAESYQNIIKKNCSNVMVLGTNSKDQSQLSMIEHGGDGNNSRNTSHHRGTDETNITYLNEAPTQSTDTASSNGSCDDDNNNNDDHNEKNHDVSFGDRSSFWNEWAEELLHKEEEEYIVKVRQSLTPDAKNTVQPVTVTTSNIITKDEGTTTGSSQGTHSLTLKAPLQPTVSTKEEDTSMYYEDPSIAFVDVTPDTSFVHNDELLETKIPVMSTTTSILKAPVLRSSNDQSKQRTTTNSLSTSNVVLSYPPGLMVSSKAGINNSNEDDDVEDDDTGAVDKDPTKKSDNTVGEKDDVAIDQANSDVRNKENEEENNVTPKVSGSRIVYVDNLAKTCPLPDDDENGNVDNVSPMKSVMSEQPQYDENSTIAADENQMINTSISTLAAMNISQATIQLPTLTLFQQAMEYSSMATEFVQNKQYITAMEYFQRAIDCYMMNQKQKGDRGKVVSTGTELSVQGNNNSTRLSILSAVNIAGCYRNMGTVSRLLERYDEVTTYLCKAEEYYTMGREIVEVRSSESILTLDGQLLNDDSTSINQQNTTSSYYTNGEEEMMCLDTMILETIQSRAYYYTKYQDDKEHAVECHEQCLKHLIHIYKVRGWNKKKSEEQDKDQENHTITDDEPIREQGVAFVPMSQESHTSLLIKSLEALGNLYRSMAAESSTKACMILFEDAIDILQCRLEQEETTNDELIKSVSLILRYLSEIYFERQELDKAVDALHDSTAIKLTASGEPCSESLEVMDKMGAAHEKMENYEKALSCYEQTLFARCRFYGNTHFYVAKSLVNVARITELKDGTTPETVELYKAANAIFALHMLSDSPSLDKDVENILQLIPTVIRQGRYEKAIRDLNMCLAMADDETNSGLKVDKAQIYFDLGRAYLGMKNYKLATSSLMNAMKEAGDVKDEDIYTLLQRVEFLQREEQNQVSKTNDTSSRSAIGKVLNASTTSLSYVPDPTLSYHDITFQLQGERSTYIFEDGQDKASIHEKSLTEQPHNSKNPLSDILYQSFIKENDEPDNKLPPATTAPQTVQDKTPLHTRIRVKLAKKVAKLVTILRAKYQNSEHLRKLKEFSKQCVKACKSKLRVGHQEQQSQKVTKRNLGSPEVPVPSEFLDSEAIMYSSFEEPGPSRFKLVVSSIIAKCGLHNGSAMSSSTEQRNRSAPMSFIHQHVVIAEEDGGFGCQLVHT